VHYVLLIIDTEKMFVDDSDLVIFYFVLKFSSLKVIITVSDFGRSSHGRLTEAWSFY
jgi:hypothetical protein